jgi:hypothetical protein
MAVFFVVGFHCAFIQSQPSLYINGLVFIEL